MFITSSRSIAKGEDKLLDLTGFSTHSEFIHTTTYSLLLYTLVWRKDILLCTAVRTHLENRMLSQVNTTPKDKCCMILFLWDTYIVRLIETESRVLVARWWRSRECIILEAYLNYFLFNLVWEDEVCLEMDGGDGSTTVWMYEVPLNFYLKWLKW